MIILQLGELSELYCLKTGFLGFIENVDLAISSCKIRHHTVNTLELDKNELSRVDGELKRVALLSRLHFL
jgi:hypothetical protein